MLVDINFWVVFAIISRLASIILLTVLVLPVQWRELNRQFRQRNVLGTDAYATLALQLLIIVAVVITCAIVPLAYNTTQLGRSDEFSLQNLSSFFTNLVILLQSIGWVIVYRSKYPEVK